MGEGQYECGVGEGDLIDGWHVRIIVGAKEGGKVSVGQGARGTLMQG